MTDEKSIGELIDASAPTAPRITPDALKANIVGEHYFTAGKAVEHGGFFPAKSDPLHLLTLCVLVLSNGFTVTGESACASPENFNAEIGCKIARKNAEQKIWPLMGYALKEEMHQRSETIKRVKDIA